MGYATAMLKQAAATPGHVTAWGWYWLALIVAITGPELYWVFVGAANTISDNTWALESLNHHHPLDLATWTWLHWVIALSLWSLFLWLSVHIPFGWL